MSDTDKAAVSANWLNKVRTACAECKDATDDVSELLDGAGLKGTDYSDVKVKSSPNPDGVHRLAVQREAAMDRLRQSRADFIAACERATEAVMELDDPQEANLLYRRYVLLEEPKEAMRVLGIKRARFYEVQRSALVNMYEHVPLSYRE